jgi:hypothetical protein
MPHIMRLNFSTIIRVEPEMLTLNPCVYKNSDLISDTQGTGAGDCVTKLHDKIVLPVHSCHLVPVE